MPITCDRSISRHYGDERGRYFSVSQVLNVVHGQPHWGSQEAMDRGTDLHRIFALAVAARAGLSEEPEVQPEYAGYRFRMGIWLTMANPEPIQIEQMGVSTLKGLPFAGTWDLLAWVHDKGKRYRFLIDLKTGQPEPWHTIQAQAYGKLCPEAERMALLYINKDGTMPTWKIVKPDPRAWASFQAAISLLQFRETL